MEVIPDNELKLALGSHQEYLSLLMSALIITREKSMYYRHGYIKRAQC